MRPSPTSQGPPTVQPSFMPGPWLIIGMRLMTLDLSSYLSHKVFLFLAFRDQANPLQFELGKPEFPEKNPCTI